MRDARFRRKVLVVEDEYFIVKELARLLEARGAEIVGPASSVERAIELVRQAEHLDGAVLDMNLHGEMVFPVADALTARGVPFVFVTGYESSAIPPRYAHVVRCQKPLELRNVETALFAHLD